MELDEDRGRTIVQEAFVVLRENLEQCVRGVVPLSEYLAHVVSWQPAEPQTQ